MRVSGIMRILVLVLIVASLLQLPATSWTGDHSIGSVEARPEYRVGPPEKISIGSILRGAGPSKGYIDPLLLNPDRVRSYVSNLSRAGLQGYYERMYGASVGPNPVGLLVKVGSLGLEGLEKVAARLGARVAKYWSQIDVALVVVPGDPELITRLSRIIACSGARYVVPDRILKPLMWDAQGILGMRSVWEGLGLTGSEVKIAIIDTGVDPSHPAIPDPIYWKDFVNNADTPYDDVGHGTHVAGIALGRPFSLFGGDYMWHSVLASDSPIFSPPVDWANLTYKIDVSAYSGQSITIALRHLYVLYENATSTSGLIFKAEASLWISFDNTTWTRIADFRGNRTAPVKDEYTVDLPAGASNLYVRLALDYLFYEANGSYYDISDWDILGWFVDELWINLTSTGTTIYHDPVDGPAPPPEVVQSYYWLRVEDSFRGMAPGADLAAAKVCSATGCLDSAILDAMNWSLETVHADIVSMSLGGTATTYDPLAEMADYLVDNGVLVVVAAGNEGPDYFKVSSPGISRKALTVAAATKGLTIAPFSSPGPSPVGGWVKPDVAGIGYEVISSITSSSPYAPPWVSELPFTSWSGTSMATPMVSGLAALVKQAHPEWNATIIKQAIIASADWLLPSYFMGYQYDVYKQGAGLIDPRQAVNMTVVPLEANIFLGNHTAYVEDKIAYTIKLFNYGSRPAQVTVESVDLYRLVPNSGYGGAVEDETGLIESPEPGTTIIVPAAGTAEVTLEINISSDNISTGYYAGHIMFSTNTSGPIKVIFGAHIRTPVMVTGVVVDHLTGEPLSGINVSVYDMNATTPTLINHTLTGPDGTYRVILLGNYSRIVVVAHEDSDHPKYHYYVSYDIEVGPGTSRIVVNPRLMPVPSKKSVLVLYEYYNSSDTYFINTSRAIHEAAERHGLGVVEWDPALLGRPISPLIYNLDSGTAGIYPVVLYLAMGSWTPLKDEITRDVIRFYVNATEDLGAHGSVIVFSGGDIAWYLTEIVGIPKYVENVLHASYIEDLPPGNYTSTVYNVTPLNTVQDFESFVENLGSPQYSVVAELSVRNISLNGSELFPDAVAPANAGVAQAGWLESRGNASIIVYSGYNRGAVQDTPTLYFAFDLAQLPDDQLEKVLDRIVVWGTDREPPSVGTLFRVDVEGSRLVLPAPNPETGEGIYDENIYGYLITITPADTSRPIAMLAIESLPASINLSSLGLVEGAIYDINVFAWDLQARMASLEKAATFRYYPGMAGEVLRTNGAASASLSLNILSGVRLEAATSGSVSIMIAELPIDSLPPLPKGIYTPGHTNVMAMDVFARDAVPGGGADNLESLVINVSIPSDFNYGQAQKTRVFWWNGTGWQEASDYRVDTENRVISILINKTTSPSTSDLAGTPIVLVYPLPSIGGILLEGPAASGHSWLAVPAALVVIVAAALAWRARRLHRGA
ncbi:MAG: S8 family serine peptidase [Desulfurococcales archaeon]|nr:S8 family serine peptidase [Desulfurococcales archaeon]